MFFLAQLNHQSVREDRSSMTPYLDDEQVAAQMRTIISAGYEPVSATIAVSRPCHQNNIDFYNLIVCSGSFMSWP